MRILIIEDNRDIAANIAQFLEGRRHTLDFAWDGVTGLHLAVANDYDAIVLDLMLPGMDGLALCRKLREDALKNTPQVLSAPLRWDKRDWLTTISHSEDRVSHVATRDPASARAPTWCG